MAKVVAVTVTFNDFDYLEKAINALREQTVEVFKIVVVDNNSNEQNKIHLQELADDHKKEIDVVWSKENLGGAGGFEQGMRYAKEKYDPDWYWLMDADAYPRKECLEKLLENQNAYSNVGILAPLIFGVDLKQYQLYHHKKLVSFLARDAEMYKTYEEIPKASCIEADAFVGPLVAKKAVDELGIADGSLFIYGDDLEYTYRISRKYAVVLVKDAVINHRDQPVNGVQKPTNWWKDYYMFRNRVLFINKYSTNIINKWIGIALVILRLAKQMLLLKKSSYGKELKKIRKNLLISAFKDGMHGKKGKIVDPATINGVIKNYEEN